jgi:serine/threonine protein phosphatase PrpC
MATDIGLVRQTNQDSLYADDQLAVIADGMGGHAAGEIAAAMAIDLVRDGYHQSPTVEGLVESIQHANAAVLSDAKDNPEHFGMGTTIIAVGLTRDREGVVSPTIVHVGDSRIYQLRDGALRQLSEDHSVAEEWVRMGRLTPEEAAVHPRRHQLTRGVGVEDAIAIDVMSIDALAGDRLLLCSDGLSNELSADSIARLASAPNGLELAVESLVSAAKVSGGRDNISVILLELDEVNAPASPFRRTMNSAPLVTANSRPSDSRRRRHITWRGWAAALVILAVIVGAVGILHWYAYSTYYLANDAGTIAVYKGQPNGVLWYKPIKVTDTQFLASRLRSADAAALAATIPEPSLTAALNYAQFMHSAWALSSATTTTTTSVTTTTLKKG